MIIYYNPECSKCQEARELLEGRHCEFEIREYLKVPPTVEELTDLVKLLGCKPEDLVRKKEPIFLERFADKTYSDQEWLKILSENPVLIERPIVIDGNKAIIGRPPELVLHIIK